MIDSFMVILANQESERAPLIRSYVRGLPSLYTESVGNFYSPMASPSASVYRFGQPDPVLGKYPSVTLTREQVRTKNQSFQLLSTLNLIIKKLQPTTSFFL